MKYLMSLLILFAVSTSVVADINDFNDCPGQGCPSNEALDCPGPGCPSNPLAAASNAYEVQKGDSLWSISAKESVYGNPYLWPLILKANREKLKSPDSIYPGMVLNINLDVSDEEMKAAVNHAKNRKVSPRMIEQK